MDNDLFTYLTLLLICVFFIGYFLGRLHDEIFEWISFFRFQAKTTQADRDALRKTLEELEKTHPGLMKALNDESKKS